MRSSAAPIAEAGFVAGPSRLSGNRAMLRARALAEMPCCSAIEITTLTSWRICSEARAILGTIDKHLARLPCSVEPDCGEQRRVADRQSGCLGLAGSAADGALAAVHAHISASDFLELVLLSRDRPWHRPVVSWIGVVAAQAHWNQVVIFVVGPIVWWDALFP